jgi:N-acetylneuraminic acid mutarotase
MSGPSIARILLAAALIVALAAVLVPALRDDGEDEPPAPGAATASWGALTPSPLARTEVGSALIGDRIHVVGGFVGEGGSTGALASYDISEDAWEEGAALPVAVNHAGVAALDGDLYVLGGNVEGEGGGESKSARLFRYGPGADEWTELSPAPTARAALGLAAIGGRLFAAGGSGERSERLRTLEIYDPGRDTWTDGPPMPTGRNHVGAAVLDGDLVVTGGRPGPEHGGTGVVERYDPERGRWHRMPPLRTARSGHATVAAAGGLVAFGGEELDGGTTIPEVEFFDPAQGEWRPLPDMPTPRHGLGGAAQGARVFAIEGGARPGLAFSDALEYLDVP